MLQKRIEGAKVLDLFAGVGTVGIEALSRGAETAVFVEASPKILRILRKNLISLCPSTRWRVVRADAKRAFAHKVLRNERFDLIFCDPPYQAMDFSIVPPYLEMLAAEGTMVVQHPSKSVPENAAETRMVGDNALSFWRKE